MHTCFALQLLSECEHTCSFQYAKTGIQTLGNTRTHAHLQLAVRPAVCGKITTDLFEPHTHMHTYTTLSHAHFNTNTNTHLQLAVGPAVDGEITTDLFEPCLPHVQAVSSRLDGQVEHLWYQGRRERNVILLQVLGKLTASASLPPHCVQTNDNVRLVFIKCFSHTSLTRASMERLNVRSSPPVLRRMIISGS